MSVRLIDLSSNNPAPYDLGAAKAGGIDGVVVKLSEGAGYINPNFLEAWNGAKAAGLWRAAYCFYQPSQATPAEQADFLCAHLPPLDTADGLVLDLEIPEAGTDLNPLALAYHDEVARRVGPQPQIFYSYLYFIQQYISDPRLAAAYHLWLADYGPSIPASVPPWPGVDLWQFSQTGSVQGITGPVDLTKASMSLADLQALGKPAPVVAHRARVKEACGLKPGPVPSHATKALAQIPGPPKGLCLDSAKRQTVGMDVWAYIEFAGLWGWVVAKNLIPV